MSNKNIIENIIENNIENEIRSIGIILYTFDKNNNLKILLINYNGYYEEIGGIIEKNDNLHKFIKRKSQNINFNINIENKLKKSKYIYNKQTKYILFLVEIKKKHINLNNKKINWILFNDIIKYNVIKYKLHHRLRNNIFLNKLSNINNMNLNKIRII